MIQSKQLAYQVKMDLNRIDDYYWFYIIFNFIILSDSVFYLFEGMGYLYI